MPAYERSRRAFAAKHGGEDVAIEHTRNRDAFCGGHDARDFLNGGGERLTMMRTRAAE
jgi:hypothetical protein